MNCFYLRTQWFKGLIPDVISEDACSEYLRSFKDPSTMHAMSFADDLGQQRAIGRPV